MHDHELSTWFRLWSHSLRHPDVVERLQVRGFDNPILANLTTHKPKTYDTNRQSLAMGDPRIYELSDLVLFNIGDSQNINRGKPVHIIAPKYCGIGP